MPARSNVAHAGTRMRTPHARTHRGEGPPDRVRPHDVVPARMVRPARHDNRGMLDHNQANTQQTRTNSRQRIPARTRPAGGEINAGATRAHANRCAHTAHACACAARDARRGRQRANRRVAPHDWRRQRLRARAGLVLLELHRRRARRCSDGWGGGSEGARAVCKHTRTHTQTRV
jgi:hypothetical protein